MYMRRFPEKPILRMRPVLIGKRKNKLMYDMYSFVPYKNKYVGMFRIDISEQIGGGGMGFITLKKTKQLNLRIKKIDIDSSIREEDPRAFLYNGYPYALFWTECSGDFYLVDLLKQEPTKIDTMELGKESQPYLGKNWVAVEKNNDLYFISSLQPLTVLKYDFLTNKVKLYYSEIGRIPQTIGIIRAGTSFIKYKNLHIAVVRATISADIHIPLLAILSDSLQSVYFKELELKTDNNEYKKVRNVFDPLSIWQDGGKIKVLINRYPTFNWSSPEVHVLLCDLVFNHKICGGSRS